LPSKCELTQINTTAQKHYSPATGKMVRTQATTTTWKFTAALFDLNTTALKLITVEKYFVRQQPISAIEMDTGELLLGVASSSIITASSVVSTCCVMYVIAHHMMWCDLYLTLIVNNVLLL